jgi:uncharacterized protein YcbX
LALHIQIDSVEGPLNVRVWDDLVPAYDMGNTAAQWFTDFLGQGATGAIPASVGPCRLARFDPQHRRLSSLKWTGGLEAPNQFSDGFPLLVMSTASLAGLNVRLGQAGAGPAQVQRFRPNVVIDGVAPFEEDLIATITTLPDAGGAVSLRMVKPCTRCTIPEVDPLTARHQPGLLQVLASFRADPKLGGAVTFGQNAVIDSGLESALRVGDALHIEHRWH